MVCRNFRVWLLCTGIEDGASWRYRNMVILARREALPSLAIRAFHNPEVVSPLWRVPLTRTLVFQEDGRSDDESGGGGVG